MARIEIMMLNWLGLLGVLIGPLIVFAATIHFLQRATQKRLAERFGWNSVLWTGWLGTPIHELSHVIMCLVFRHRIDAVSLFEPDPDSGRLGYVRHSWRAGNWYEELGNLFIGIAPLIGGSTALWVLLGIFYPATFSGLVEEPTGSPTLVSADSSLAVISVAVSSVFTRLLQPQNLTMIKFWVFVYLVFCIGSHMAPSWSDYRKIGRGAILCLSLMTISLIIASVFVTDFSGVQTAIVTILSPLYALFAITILLCLAAATIACLAIGYFPKRYEVR